MLVLVPFPALVKYGGKADDQQEGDEEDHGIEVGAVRLHLGAFVPAGQQADHGWDDDQQAEGYADEELAEYFFMAEAVGFPVFNKRCFFIAQHGAKLACAGDKCSRGCKDSRWKEQMFKGM